MEVSGVGLWELPERECRSLLTSVTTGYLAVSDRALPTVVPVHIHCFDDEVEVESLIGDSIPLKAGSVVALAATTIGEGLASEWMVEVRGFLRAGDSTISDLALPAAESFRLSIDVVSGWRRTVSSIDVPEPVEVLTNSSPTSS